MIYDIFISYRRLDEKGNISGRDQARLIAKQLKLEGFHPFFDYSEIKDNEFDKVILPAIENCKVFILVLTKDSLNRCKNEEDWVRKEIETALQSGCKIINVTPDNSFNGWPSCLPNTLSVIKNIQISDIHMGSLFEVSVKELIKNRILAGLEQQNKSNKNIGLHQDESGRFGLYNNETNSIITEAKYDYVSSFREGYAQIEANQKFGIINSNGIEVIPLTYDFVDIPSGELFSAHVSGRYGCLDKKNNIVIPFVFDELWVWNDIIVVRIGDKYGCLNRKNEVVIPIEYDDIEPTSINIVASKHAKYGCFDLLGKETVPFIYDYIDVETFHEGWAIACKEGKYGTIDKLGQVIIKFSYDQLNRGYNDEYNMLSAVIDGKEGRLNITGDVVIPIIYDEVGYRHDDYLWNEFGLAQVTKNGLVGAINKSGQEVIPPIYSFMSFISDDLWCVELNDKWGFINEDNNIVIPFDYEELSSFKDGIAVVKKNEKYGFIDKRNNIIIPFVYDSIDGGFCEDLCNVTINGKVGFIDRTGRMVIEPKFDRRTGHFSCGRARISRNGKYGFIDKTGKTIIPCKYDRVWNDFKDGVASVRKENTDYKIDINGKVLSKYSLKIK